MARKKETPDPVLPQVEAGLVRVFRGSSEFLDVTPASSAAYLAAGWLPE